MTTKRWIVLLCLVLAVSVGLSFWLLSGENSEAVEIWSQGERLYTLPLDVDTEVKVTAGGTNVVRIQSGKVAVVQADCPDGYCMARGYCSGGAQIVCLPNRLVIRFTGKQAVDGVAG